VLEKRAKKQKSTSAWMEEGCTQQLEEETAEEASFAAKESRRGLSERKTYLGKHIKR